MELHSRMFKDSAIQCSYQTQKATISKVEALETQVIVSHREVMQNIARSRSEASLHHWTSDHVLQTESQNSQRNMQDLQNEITLLREDQSKLDARLRTKAEIQWLETELLKTELRKVLKEFHRSNGRIDRNTNDSQYP